VKKTRQNKKLQPDFDFNQNRKDSARQREHDHASARRADGNEAD
jgi:hypothetical protein